MASPKKILFISKNRDPKASLNNLFQCKDCQNEEPLPSALSEFPLVHIASFYPFILEKALCPCPL